MLGGSFTWNGGLNNQPWLRLYRFLVFEGWEGPFSGVVQCILPRPLSDHLLILLDGGGLRRDPSPFRFENMWLKDEEFKDMLKRWWVGFNFRGFCSFILVEKLKILKAKLKSWNKEAFVNVVVRKNLVIS